MNASKRILTASQQLTVHEKGKMLPNNWIKLKSTRVAFEFPPSKPVESLQVEVMCNETSHHTGIIERMANLQFDQDIFSQIRTLTDKSSVAKFSENVDREAVLELNDHIHIDPVSGLVYSQTQSGPSNISVWSVLPKDKCEQFTISHLGVELLNKTKVDYTTVSF